MIELRSGTLQFAFPEVHPHAQLSVRFQRTLRIPDDDSDYPLPPGLGSFPLQHVDDFANGVPKRWLSHGGVMLPMYQSEAMWISFDRHSVPGRGASYPFAVKLAAGKINAVTGQGWANGLAGSPQDYMVVPIQPWLDGYCVEKGFIRQFVAMPLGAGYSAEEQLTGEAEHGGMQLLVCPMKAEVFEKRFPKRAFDVGTRCCVSAPPAGSGPDMGLAPGGRMRQEIYQDPYDLEDWDQSHFSRCFVHIVNSVQWRSITGEMPPCRPPTVAEYNRAGLPWFEYYDESGKAVTGSTALAGLKSAATMARQIRDGEYPQDEPISPGVVIELRRDLGRHQVREAQF